MTIKSPQKRGFCPRVWSPMESGDGLIVRVHPGLAALRANKLGALITLAAKHGNGQIDITRRANLQLRGIAQSELLALQEALVETGWAPATQAGERDFALLTSPWLDLDPENAALLQLAQKLERALVSEAAPALLHPKLCLSVDDAARTLRDVAADLTLAPCAGQPGRVLVWVRDGEQAPLLLGSCAHADVVALVLRVLRLLNPPGVAPLRMHEWIARFGLYPLRMAVSDEVTSCAEPTLAGAPARSLVGYHTGTRPWFGLSLPFGSGSTQQWRALQALGRQFGSGLFQTTHSRALLVLDVAKDKAAALAAAADAAGLIWREDAAIARLVACTGAPLCGAAQGETRALALSLSESVRPLLEGGARLHVSGCEKSCAHSGPSALTLVHSAAGLHLGRACSASEAVARPALTLTEARAELEAIAREYATSAPLAADSEKPR